MGFKLPGKSIQTGTSGHASALKQKAKTYKEAYRENLKFKSDADDDYTKVDKYGKEYGGIEKPGRAEFTKAAKAWNMKTYGTHNPTADAKKGGMTKKELAAKHKASKTAEVKTPEVETKVKPTKTEKVQTKAADKVTKIEAKSAKKVGEVSENVSKKVKNIRKKDARKEFGRGSKEHLAAKKAHLEAKAIDIQGGIGGRKRGLFRGVATKINLKKQKKNQAKIDALKEEK